ncbi:MAG: prolipoprotein diacylglyceryl transferase [Spirochaetota bacterium]|nr:prolipoprotein diacylglyceryl transferase [Spirochaetota bacterium]
MYPGYSLPVSILTGDVGWVILIITVIIAFAFYYLTNLEKKKLKSVKDGKTRNYKIFSNLFYIAILVVLILLYIIISEQETLPLNSYGFMLGIAFIVGAYLVIRKGRKLGIKEESLLDLSLWGVIASIVGARLFFMLFEFETHSVTGQLLYGPPYAFFHDPLAFITKIKEGGLVVYGGFIVGVLFALVFIKKKNLPLGKVADIYAPSLALGIAFTRFGCNLAGCCWGAQVTSDHFLGISLSHFHENSAVYHFISPESSSQAANIFIWPAQIISSINGLVMFIILSIIFHKYQHKFKYNGILFHIFMIYYAITRILIEFIRNDTPKSYGLSAAQYTGIVIIIIAIVLMIYNFGRAKKLKTT